MPEMLQRYRLVRLFLQCPFLYLLFSWVARSRNRAKHLACAWLQVWQLTLGCGVNSPHSQYSLAAVGRWMAWQLSSLGRVHSSGNSCNLPPCTLHCDPSAFLLHPSMIEILRSPKMCMLCIQKTAKHDCIRESVLAIGRTLILGAPGALLAPSRGWGHVSQPCEDTCLSRLIQGHVSSRREGQSRECHQISRCAM